MRTAVEIDVASRYVQSAFFSLADHAEQQLRGAEVFTMHLRAEDSDFVRLNGNRVRQAGNVRQRVVTVRLIDGKRHASMSMTATGVQGEDRRRDPTGDAHRGRGGGHLRRARQLLRHHIRRGAGW